RSVGTLASGSPPLARQKAGHETRKQRARNERARKSIAQEQATNSDFEQSSGFREALRPPTQKWGRRDCSRIALGHLVARAALSERRRRKRRGPEIKVRAGVIAELEVVIANA